MGKVPRKDPNDVVITNPALPGNAISSYSPNVMAAPPPSWDYFDKGASWLLPGYNSAKKFAEGIQSKDYLKAALGLGGAAYSVGTFFAPQFKVGNIAKNLFLKTATGRALNRLAATGGGALSSELSKQYQRALQRLNLDVPYWSSPSKFDVLSPAEKALLLSAKRGSSNDPTPSPVLRSRAKFARKLDFGSAPAFGPDPNFQSSFNLGPYLPGDKATHIRNMITKANAKFAGSPTMTRYIQRRIKNDPYAHLPNKGKNPL